MSPGDIEEFLEAFEAALLDEELSPLSLLGSLELFTLGAAEVLREGFNPVEIETDDGPFMLPNRPCPTLTGAEECLP
jgi:hypothetical protein